MMGATTIVTIRAMNREVTDKELESATMGNALTYIIVSIFSSIPTIPSCIIGGITLADGFIIGSPRIYLLIYNLNNPF